MSGVATAIVGTQVVGGYLARESANRAAGRASSAQQASAREGIDQIRELLLPYAEAGIGATGAQEALLGLGTPEEQQAAIEQIAGSPQFQALTQSGEESILQNAAATGGVRGGNVQAALSQFRPQLLSNLIEQQFSRLGTVANRGVGAAGTGSTAIADLLGQIGQAKAGEALAKGQNTSNFISGTVNAIGGAIGGLF